MIQCRAVLSTLLLLAATACGTEPDIDTEARAQAARATVKEFAATLQGELRAAMQAGGPPAAISVCREAAPAIAADLSSRTGWRVARTSHRLRNPANAPDAHEARVLQQFLAARAEGDDPATLEEYGVEYMPDGDRVFRYMKAIPAQGACLTCHGRSLAPDVAEALAAAYPQDQATGFAEGDIRGAFTIIQPLDG